MITFNKLIKNFQKFDTKGASLIQKQVYDLFEPIVYQAILLTRMDTGKGRASLGIPFTKIIPSQRIKDAIDYDVEVSSPAYYHWSHQAHVDPMTDYRGTAKALVDSRKIVVEVISYDQGVINQEYDAVLGDASGGLRAVGRPSAFHPRVNPERHIVHHIDQTARAFDGNGDLEHFNGSGVFLDSVAKDIQERTKALYRRVEELLFT